MLYMVKGQCVMNVWRDENVHQFALSSDYQAAAT